MIRRDKKLFRASGHPKMGIKNSLGGGGILRDRTKS
jgi:hypothetical protein